MDACPKAVKEEFHGRLRLVFDAPCLETARRLKDKLVRDYASLAPKVVERLDEGLEDAMAVMALPTRYRKRLQTKGAVERLNKEIRRRDVSSSTRHRPGG